MMGIFIRGNSDTETRQVQRKDNVNTHGKHHLQTKEYLRRLKARREAWNTLSLPTLGRNQTLLRL